MLSCVSTKQLTIATLAQPFTLLDSLLTLFVENSDGLFSYLVATSSLTGAVRLFFEVSEHLQMGLIGKAIDKEREIATPFFLS